MRNFAYVIVGAGFAGAATAYHLARQGVADVLVLEQESIPGFHASGRNAAMLRQCIAEPDLTKLALDGAAFIRNLPDGLAGAGAIQEQRLVVTRQRCRLGEAQTGWRDWPECRRSRNRRVVAGTSDRPRAGAQRG